MIQSVVFLLLAVVAAVATAITPSVEVKENAIVLSVVAGASVSVQYLAADTGLPVGEPQPIATQADLAALRNELLTAVATKANTTSVYTTAQTDALLKDKASTASIYTRTEADLLLDAKADATDVATKVALEEAVKDVALSSNVYSKTEVDAFIHTDVTSLADGFKAGVPQTGWTYYYNANGDIGDPANYKELVWNAGRKFYSVSPTAFPEPSEPLGPFVYLSGHLGHPGRAEGQADQPRDTYVIAAYEVPYDGVFTLRDSLFSTGDELGDGSVVQVYVNKKLMSFNDIVGIKADFRPEDNHDFEGTFDTFLGQLVKGDVIYVAVGPRASDSNDGFSWKFSIAAGILPMLAPNDFDHSPLFGQARFTTRSWFWSGTAGNGADDWNTILTGDQRVLDAGVWLFKVAGFDSYVDSQGVGAYDETLASSPFSWYTDRTNSVEEDTFDVHHSGHSRNGQKLLFRTVRQADPGYLALQFRLVGAKAWTSAVGLEFTFLRLM